MTESFKPRPRKRTRPISSKPTADRRVLVLLETSRNFERQILEGIAKYAKDAGNWQVHFELYGFNAMLPSTLQEWRGDGIIARTTTKEQGETVRVPQVSLVDMGGNPECGVGNIDSDDAMMSRMAVEHFLDLGLRHFAFFTYAAAWWIDTHRRFFCDILDEYGFECHVYSAPPSSHPTKIIWNESERKPIIEWLGSLPRPIGIYTPGDWIAVRLLEICRENGIAVPEEVAILGLENDVTVCESVKPTLSSIELDMQCLGYEAARLLDRLMNGEKIPKEPLIVPPSGVIARQSTAIMLLEDDVLHALRYIRENACHGIDVDQVAKAMGLSRSALHRRFLSQLKRTAKSEIMRVRIERARELLKQSEKISESLARKCGFASLRYFTLAFSREVGITPAAYRRVRQHSPVSGEAKAF